VKEISELKEQVRCYEEVLAQLQKPFRSPQEETAVQLFSRLLFDATNKLKKVERGAVKLHYQEEEADQMLAKKRGIRFATETSTIDGYVFFVPETSGEQ
jgi:hypothetical protein